MKHFYIDSAFALKFAGLVFAVIVLLCLLDVFVFYTAKDGSSKSSLADWSLVVLTGLGLIVLFISLTHTATVIADTRELGEAGARAYISIDIKTEYGKEILRNGAIVQIEIQNDGNTPARNLNVQANIDVLKKLQKGMPVSFDYGENTKIENQLARGDSRRVSIEIRNIKEDLFVAAWRNNSHLLYVFGKVSYEDVFRKPQFTEFCFSFSKKLKNRDVAQSNTSTDKSAHVLNVHIDVNPEFEWELAPFNNRAS